MNRKCKLTNISRINPKYHGRCRRYIAAGRATIMIKPDISANIDEQYIRRYKHQGEITWDKEGSKWNKSHVLLAEYIEQKVPKMPERPIPEPPIPDVVEINVELEQKPNPEPEPESGLELKTKPEQEPEVVESKTISLKTLLGWDLKRLNKFKNDEHISITGYRSMSKKEKATAVYEAYSKSQ